ncbi:MAG: type IV pilus modification protein PilV [Rhodoferax sp.]
MLIVKRQGMVRRTSRRKIRGVSLLEVLVAILLSAIGLLALAGANVASIRYSKMSQYRGTATVLALDLGERMRANKAGVLSYSYNATDFATQTGAAIASDTSCESIAIPSPCAAAASLAAYDLNTWRKVVRSQLPKGAVFIDIMDAAGNVCLIAASCIGADVWIAWEDQAVANPDENSTDSRNAALECPNGLNLGADKAVRCSFFRINL